MNMNKEYSERKMIFPIITEEAAKLPFYVTGVGSLENQHDVLRTKGLSDYHFLYTTKGKGYLRIDDKEFYITPNMGFYFEPNVPHEYYAVEEPWTTWWVMFKGYAAKDFPVIMEFGRYLVFYVHEIDRLNKMHNDIYTSAAYTGLSSTADASSSLYKFLLELNFCIGTEARKAGQCKINQLQSLLTYLENNFNSDITLADMARIVDVSPQHLCRLFKQAFNMRPFEYLTSCRLQKAKEFLTSGNKLVLKEVADKTGFNDVSYFCSVFKEYEGMTPLEFKRMHREV